MSRSLPPNIAPPVITPPPAVKLPPGPSDWEKYWALLEPLLPPLRVERVGRPPANRERVAYQIYKMLTEQLEFRHAGTAEIPWSTVSSTFQNWRSEGYLFRAWPQLLLKYEEERGRKFARNMRRDPSS